MKPTATHSQPETRWIDSLWTFVVAVAIAGPFALPLLWRNPHYSRKKKVFWSLGVLAFTALLLIATGSVLKETLETLEELKRSLRQF